MKLNIFYTGHLYASNGASKVVKTLYENKNQFLKYGINIGDLYCLSKSTINSNKSKGNLKRNLMAFFRKTYLGSIIGYHIMWTRNAKKVVSNYIEEKSIDTVNMFHDIYSLYQFKKQHKNEQNKCILVLHTDGETWKMLFTYFNKLNRKSFVNYLLKIEKYALELVDSIILVSNQSHEKFNHLHPNLSDKTFCIQNGIDEKGYKFRSGEEKIKLVTVGSVCQRKNQISIIKALEIMKNDQISLKIVGYGDKFEEYNEYVKSKGLSSQISFLGNQIDVDSFLNESNVFIMASYDEGLPIAGIEALRNALPVILSDVGGNRELIKDNGILIEPKVSSIIEAIETFVNKPDLLEKCSMNSYKLYTERFSSQSMIKKYSELIISITGKSEMICTDV